ncbi:MAG: hypothetical protein ABSH20_14335 [Tepidisphaeraceae bacterium]
MKTRTSLACRAVCCVSFMLGTLAASGQTLDVAPFGQVMHWDKDGRDHGVMWEDARDIFRVVVEFAGEAPKADAVRVEYWQSQWPQQRIPRDRPSGSGGSGWLNVGDWYQGKWQTADATVEARGSTLTWTFNPVNAKEFKGLKGFDAKYRSTMKLRLLSDQALPAIKSLEAHTDSTLAGLGIEVEWADAGQDARIEVFNGMLVKAAETAGNVTRANVLYAQPVGFNSFDETVVTVRATPEKTFSFAASDLNKWGRIFLPDLRVLVRKSGESVTYATAEKAWREAKAQEKTMDLYSRVAKMPEQTLTRAWADTPAKQPQYIPLSFEGTRQHFRSDPNGDIVLNKNWISRIKGKDTPRCKWDGDELRYSFGLPKSPLTKRELDYGGEPIITNEWIEGGVKYQQRACALPLAMDPDPHTRVAADDPMVLTMRIEMENVADAQVQARLEFSVTDGKGIDKLDCGSLPIALHSAKYDTNRLWLSRDTAGFAQKTDNGKVSYGAKLEPKEKRHLEVRVCFIDHPEKELGHIPSELSFQNGYGFVTDYWNCRRLRDGTGIETPEPMINAFYRADAAHLLINTEREVGDSDCYMAKVGTFSYGVYANESTMMISDLDRRGYHDVAARALETFLKYQSTVALPGDYASKEGEFYGAHGYEAGGYNQHHGWVLWCMGEHYWYTRDAKWMEHAAPGLVKACEWIIRERGRSTERAGRERMRAIEKGLLPPGSLEDIGDWRCWLSNNVFSWWGMDNTARALVAAGNPEGPRLLKEAQAYHADLIAAFTEAMRRSPVVRLRDGSWVPKVPSDAHRRGRSFGWITETLEGAIYLIRTGAIDPNSPLATWIIKDYEDNLYLSEQFGYKLPDAEFERRWFSHGGVSQQANLLQNPMAYLLRDEPQHYVRAYFNAFAVSYFADTRMMTEHALPNIGDWRGDHYKTSDESNSTYWLRLMFVQERGEELWLGAAIPRYWLADGKEIGIGDARTYFGPMSMGMESAAAKGRITMTLSPPTRNPPKVIRARFRHPEGKRMVRCEVNGKPYERFDAEKEWVELRGLAGETKVVAYYE